MAINYTKRGWTNNSPPAINAANLGAMDDALKLTADKVDTIAEGADVTATALASAIEGGTPTTTPDDTDKLPGVKSDHSRLYYTWANIKTALGSVFAPLTHASRHQHGGADEIATATPAANAIPKADSSGKLDSWISDASASTKGKVQLATSAELEAGTDAAKALTPAVVRPATIKRTKMPDGATAVYSQDAWATTDGWYAHNCSLTTDSVNGVLHVDVTSSNNHIFKSLSNSYFGSIAIIRYRSNKSLVIKTPVGGSTYLTLPASTSWQTAMFPLLTEYYVGDSSYYTRLSVGIPSGVTGDWFELDWVWVGSYSYLSGTLSESGATAANVIGDTTGVAAYASGTITSNGTNVSDGDTITIHGRRYFFKTTLTPTDGEVLIGATAQESLANLALAINRTDPGTNDGVKYKIAAAHPLVSAAANSLTLTVTALQTGELGNQITLVKSAATLTLSGSTFKGGYSATAKKLATLAAPIIAGNGTRPAAALIELTDTTKIGYEAAADVQAGNTLTLPSGGTWLWFVYGYGATINSAKRGISAGGTILTVNGANATVWYRRYA